MAIVERERERGGKDFFPPEMLGKQSAGLRN